MSRAEVEARGQAGNGNNVTRKGANNPMNRLVPYLDLFWRLSDDELSRLARAPISAVEGLRQQVEEVNRALGRYVDLLPRLSDDELARLTGASSKTIRFWRLSQPRHLQGDSRRAADAPARREPSSAQSSGSMARDEELSSEHSSSQPLRVAVEQSGGEVTELAPEHHSEKVVVDTQ